MLPKHVVCCRRHIKKTRYVDLYYNRHIFIAVYLVTFIELMHIYLYVYK